MALKKLYSLSTKSVFISYRRKDTAGHCGRLYDRLAAHFGADQVFMDISAIDPGQDFTDAIKTAVGSCNALIALIGEEWLNIKAGGKRRLDDPADFVRIEIASALDRGIAVIPVLVQGAHMPQASDLPECLKALAKRNAIELSDSRWNQDVDRLILAIEKLTAKPDERKSLKRLPLVIACVLVIASIAVFILYRSNRSKHPDDKPAEIAAVTEPKVDDITAQKPGDEVLNIQPSDRPIAISLIFEYGRPRNYSGVFPIGEFDLLYGTASASLKDGSLFNLLNSYAKADGARFSDQIRPYLRPLSNKEQSLINDERFISILRQAGGEDPVMVQVQKKLFMQKYLEPAMNESNSIGIKTRLGIAVVADAILFQGVASHKRLKDQTRNQLDGTPITGIDEKKWIKKYLENRHAFLANNRLEPLKKTVYRPDFYLALANMDNWDLSKPFSIRGFYITDQ